MVFVFVRKHLTVRDATSALAVSMPTQTVCHVSARNQAQPAIFVRTVLDSVLVKEITQDRTVNDVHQGSTNIQNVSVSSI